MKPGTCERALLRQLAATPFCDRLDLAALSGWSQRAVYTATARIEEEGFAASLPHATDLIPPTRRFHLTAAGVLRLALELDLGVDELLGARPISAHWRRLLLGRLDALAVIYRLAATLCSITHPLRFRWYRASPVDAALVLSDGRSIGVVRQGLASDRTAFSKRLRRLYEDPLPGALLVFVPDEVRLRHARRLLRDAPIPAFLALERHVAASDADRPIWRMPSLAGVLGLRGALSVVSRRGVVPSEPRQGRALLPRSAVPAEQLLPSQLTPAEKRALDVLFGWPWITLGDLAGLLGVSPQRASQLLVRLEEFDLATRTLVAGRRRLAVTDRGLALIARRDRASVGAVRNRWSAVAIEPCESLDWRNVSGSRSRQLLRHLEHTEAVHGFVAALARQARERGWELVQLDPPQRASRYFRHSDALHSVQPDAFGILRREKATWPFFLEWERRAVRPVTMAARLAPYLRYFSSERPLEDHGVQPSVLVVFDDELAGVHFRRVAQEEMERTGIELPLWVSHRAALGACGLLEAKAWHRLGNSATTDALGVSN
ncbi:MAG: replication-relaxation family protein [Chloroflexota bacterium]|nr:replication-relaxation family protein [Chloroflexota bacterium]